jgi:ankyrin repeat protein
VTFIFVLTFEIDHDALVHGAYYGHVEPVKVLIDAGCKVSKLDKLGQIPLHHAASQGHLAVVKELVARGSSRVIKNNDGTVLLSLYNCTSILGQTPRDLAIKNNRTEVAAYLSSIICPYSNVNDLCYSIRNGSMKQDGLGICQFLYDLNSQGNYRRSFNCYIFRYLSTS